MSDHVLRENFAHLPKAEVFARLAGGLAAGVTVVTPNSRLAQSLAREFDAAQAAGGLVSWESADVLSYSAFVLRLYEDALYSELAPKLPLLLTGAQEQALWEDAIRASSLSETLLSASSAAADCRAAWELAHAWGLAPKLKDAAGNEDAHAFLDWSARYERATERNRQTDAARLPQVIEPFIAGHAVRKPRALALYAFDIVNVRQRALFAALAEAGVEIFVCGPEPRAGIAKRFAFTAAKDEMLACARWARAILESPSPQPSPSKGEGRGEGQPRIGIVVPDLAKSRTAVQRIFASVMQPASQLPNRGQTPFSGDGKWGLSPVLPFNISLGLALNSFPLVHDALLALQLAGREIEFARASRLLRSPFLAGADAELGARARLDALLRERAGTSVTLDSLIRLMALRGAPPCAVLGRSLAKLAEFRKAHLFGAKPASDWARLISGALDALGFPGERVLDSPEFQTAKKWRELLAGFAALDRVQGKMGYAEACRQLARMAADTLFQPEAHDVPIQILGVLESAGLEFDHLWVMGLTDEAWPLPARPNPFVPVALQRAAGVPEADAAGSFELDRRITAGWRVAAAEVVFSHPEREGDRELAASPLIAVIDAAQFAALGVPDYPDLRRTIRGNMAGEPPLERISGDLAPPLAASGEVHSGGTGLFRDQAACPFRAFAAHRLGADALASPEPGLSAMDRGTLVHDVLAFAWSALGGSNNLQATSAADLAALLARAADEAIAKLRRRKPEALQGRFAALEKARLAGLARDWLDIEKLRPDFDVIATEEKRLIAFGGVAVNARLDRLDRLATGGHALLDYKTGAASVADWLGARPDEPQLPLYALGLTENENKDIAAVAFARVKAGEREFTGIGREKGLIPGVKTIGELRSARAKAYASWDDLLAGWRRELEALGRGFAQGDARVAPKRPDDSCKFCGRQPLCRINERGAA